MIRPALLSVVFLPALAAAGEVLTLDAYLDQVRKASPALAAAAATVEGIPLKAKEAEMVYSPLFTANYGLFDDRKEPTSALSPSARGSARGKSASPRSGPPGPTSRSGTA